VIDNVRFMCTLGHTEAMRPIIDTINPVNSEASSLSASLSSVASSSSTTTTTTTTTTGEAVDTFTSLLQAGPTVQDEQLLKYARHNGTTVYHPVGTCRMGNDGGHRSVVDSTLRVHGMKGLSVCDASVMPNIVSANTNATSMMIGVAGAALIQRRLLNKSHHRGNHGSHKRRNRSRSRSYSTTTLTSASAAATPVSLGFDFGTESCRACLVDVSSGNVVGDGTWKYASGQITGLFPGWVDGEKSPKEMASHVVLQDSNDWWLSAKEALNLAFQNSTVRPTCCNLLLPFSSPGFVGGFCCGSH
jgi:hypothetical protein